MKISLNSGRVLALAILCCCCTRAVAADVGIAGVLTQKYSVWREKMEALFEVEAGRTSELGDKKLKCYYFRAKRPKAEVQFMEVYVAQNRCEYLRCVFKRAYTYDDVERFLKYLVPSETWMADRDSLEGRTFMGVWKGKSLHFTAIYNDRKNGGAAPLYNYRRVTTSSGLVVLSDWYERKFREETSALPSLEELIKKEGKKEDGGQPEKMDGGEKGRKE